VNVLKSSKQLIKEEFIVFFSKRLIALDDLCEISIHHFGNNITLLHETYTSSNYSLDLGRIIVSMLMMFSCFSSFKSLNSRNVLFAKILC
jgi:hypothetical protein